ETEWEGDFFDRGRHWIGRDVPYEVYTALGLTLENALYSPSGQWGVLISHEQHALVAGTAAFVSALRACYPNWRSDVKRLRERWRNNDRSGWVGPVLARVGDDF